MRQLTEAENEARMDSLDTLLEYAWDVEKRKAHKAGFIAGLEYQDKRIEALEMQVKESTERLREELGIG